MTRTPSPIGTIITLTPAETRRERRDNAERHRKRIHEAVRLAMVSGTIRRA